MKLKQAKSKNLRPIRLIKKSNDLIEARHSLGTWEMRIFLKIIFLVNEEKYKGVTNFIIPIRELIRDFKLENSRQSYQYFRDAREALATRTIQIFQENTETNKWERVNKSLFSETAHSVRLGKDGSMEDDDRDGYIRLQLHEQIKPFLININGSLDGNYTLFDKQYVVELPVKMLRFYFLLKRFADLGSRELSIEELRDIFDLEGKYQNYGNIKQRFLEKARRELAEKTDIRFDYDEIKGKGKTVVAVKFRIYPNAPAERQSKSLQPGSTAISTAKTGAENQPIVSTPPAATGENAMDDAFEKHYLKVRAHGISAGTLASWVQKYPSEHLEAAISDFQEKVKKGQIRETDPLKQGGYLRTLIETADYTLKMTAEKSRAANRQKAQEVAQQTEAVQSASDLQKRAKAEQDRKLANEILAENPNLIGELTHEINHERFEDYQPSDFEQNALFRVLIIGKLKGRFAAAFS